MAASTTKFEKGVINKDELKNFWAVALLFSRISISIDKHQWIIIWQAYLRNLGKNF